MEDCLPWEGLHVASEKGCEESHPKEEGAAGMTWKGLGVTTAPVPCPPTTAGVEEVENWQQS